MASLDNFHVTCPIEDCDYWADYGGYLDIFVKHFYRHIEKDHPDLPIMLRRRRGGIIDTMIGDALLRTGRYRHALVNKDAK